MFIQSGTGVEDPTMTWPIGLFADEVSSDSLGSIALLLGC